MKKFLFLMTIISMTFVGCEPMDDIYEEIDTDLSVQGVADYTLTEEDYEELDLGFANFNSIADAKEMLPEFLSNKYPVWGKGSLATVTFDIYAPKRDEKDLIVYQATAEDYAAYGDDAYPNFDRMWQVTDLIEDKFADVPDRTLISLTYDYYEGGTTERNDGFLLVNGEWIYAVGFTEDEYNAMGESYANFSNEDEADAKIPVFLAEKFKYEPAEQGEIVPVMYKLYGDDVYDIDGDGNVDENTTSSFVKYFVFNGTSWLPYTNTVSETIQFGHDGETWIPDNTIQYSFTTEDYALVASELASVYSAQAGNLDSYGNFNRTGGSTSWDDDMMLAAINVVLNNLDSSAEVGQKYMVSYVIYAGGYSIETKSVIKDSTGAWVYNQ